MAFGIEELNNRFSNIIMGYINKGFKLSPLTHNGSFSRSGCYLDVKDPKEKGYIYRIWMIDDDTALAQQRNVYVSTKILRVKKYKYDGKYTRTFWPDEGDFVSEKIFYVVKAGKSFTDSVDEINDIYNLRNKRRDLKPKDNNSDYTYCRKIAINKLPEDFIDNIMEKINKIRGFKRASATCIKSVLLYKESYYNYSKRCTTYKLKGTVNYSFNGRTGNIYIG